MFALSPILAKAPSTRDQNGQKAKEKFTSRIMPALERRLKFGRRAGTLQMVHHLVVVAHRPCW